MSNFLFIFLITYSMVLSAQIEPCPVPLQSLDPRNRLNVERIYTNTTNTCLDSTRDTNYRCSCLTDMQQTTESPIFIEQRDLLTRRLALEQAVDNLDSLRKTRLSNLPSYFQFPQSCLEVAEPSGELNSSCGPLQLQEFLAPGETQLPPSITQRLFDHDTLREKLQTMQGRPLDLGRSPDQDSFQAFLRSLLSHTHETVSERIPNSQAQLFLSLRNVITMKGFREGFEDLYPELYPNSTPEERSQAMIHFEMIKDLFNSPRLDADFSRYLSESVSLAIADHRPGSPALTAAIDRAVLQDGIRYLQRFDTNGSVHNIISNEIESIETACQDALDSMKNLCLEPRRSRLEEVNIRHLFKVPNTIQPELGVEILKCESLNKLKRSRSELRHFDDNAMNDILHNVYRYDRNNETSQTLRTNEHRVTITELLDNAEALDQNKPIFMSRVLEEATRMPNLTPAVHHQLYAASRSSGERLQAFFSSEEFKALVDPDTGLDVRTSVRIHQSAHNYEFQGPMRREDYEYQINTIVAAATSSQVTIPTQVIQSIATESMIPTRDSVRQNISREQAQSIMPRSTASMSPNTNPIRSNTRAPASMTSLASPSALTETQNAGIRPFNSTVINQLGTGRVSTREREEVTNGVEDLRRYTAEKEESLRNLQENYERQKNSMSPSEKSEFENLLAQMNTQIDQLKRDREIIEQKLQDELTRAPANVTRSQEGSRTVNAPSARPFDFDNSSSFDPISSSSPPSAARSAIQAPLSASGGGFISNPNAGASALRGSPERVTSTTLNSVLGLVSSPGSASVIRLGASQDLQSYAQDLKNQLSNGQSQIVEVSRTVDGRDVIEVYEFVMQDGEVQYTLVDSRREEPSPVEVTYDDQRNIDETVRTNARITRVAQLEALMRERLGL